MEAFTTTTGLSLEEAEAAVRSSLAEQGFGVLTEIDIAATFKQKLDVDRAPLKILGACNPHLAHQALTLDPSAALALPCNVVLEATEDGTKVSAVDPHEIMDDPAFGELADDAAAKLRAAIHALS